MRYIDIQNEVIKKYDITLSDGSDCKCGWCRMHAHRAARKVCKWKQKNSAHATFELLHEIGHIENNSSSMRRAEQEYYATVWALGECAAYGVEVPDNTIKAYQNYIDREIDRGVRRGGKGYGKLKLPCITG